MECRYRHDKEPAQFWQPHPNFMLQRLVDKVVSIGVNHNLEPKKWSLLVSTKQILMTHITKRRHDRIILQWSKYDFKSMNNTNGDYMSGRGKI